MSAAYPTRYRDRHGEVVTQLHNDGQTLSMVVRGVEFRGRDFDGLEPTPSTDPAALSPFTLQHGDLCACTLDFEMPLPVVIDQQIQEGTLTVHLELGEPTPKGGIDREILSLTLNVGGRVYRSPGTSGWFEDELLELQRRLPEGAHLKACITCAFSDYSPYGHGLFGGLACFRGNKPAYQSIQGKADLFRVWDTLTGFVQETYLCPEFERRTPGTGYRG